MPNRFRLFLSLAACLLPVVASAQTGSSQNVTLSGTVQIPGAELKAGTYAFSVEDRLRDRAIVRITNSQDASEHYLLLSVPNPKLSASSADQLTMFKNGNESKQALRAWKCATCKAPLEFVYPKLEAVKLTDDSTQPVLAVDPTYDKLPANLSADDMKVVTLWLLSPQRITADNVGEGVKAAKYASVANPSPEPTQEASAAPAPAAPTESASIQGRHKLPKTASNTYLYSLLGFGCLGGALALRMKRLQRA